MLSRLQPRAVAPLSRTLMAAAAGTAAPGAARAFAGSAAPSTASGRFPGPITHNQHTAHMTAGVGQLTPIIAERAQGSFIYGKDGKEYLDFCCGIGVTNLGHCHPKVRHTAPQPA